MSAWGVKKHHSLDMRALSIFGFHRHWPQSSKLLRAGTQATKLAPKLLWLVEAPGVLEAVWGAGVLHVCVLQKPRTCLTLSLRSGGGRTLWSLQSVFRSLWGRRSERACRCVVFAQALHRALPNQKSGTKEKHFFYLFFFPQLHKYRNVEISWCPLVLIYL